MSVYSFDYSDIYTPPAPILELGVSKTAGTSELLISALVDSGADATMLPLSILQQIGARFVETRQMRGVTGVAQKVDCYRVTVRIGSQVIPGIRAIATTSSQEAIIGRDVLNQLVVTLNGLAQVVEIMA